MSTKTKVMSLICAGLSLCVVVIVTNATDRVAAAGEGEHPRVVLGTSAFDSARTLRGTNVVTERLTPSQAAQSEKTVEQTRKNIQVLKGLPDSQLFLVILSQPRAVSNCSLCSQRQRAEGFVMRGDARY